MAEEIQYLPIDTSDRRLDYIDFLERATDIVCKCSPGTVVFRGCTLEYTRPFTLDLVCNILTITLDDDKDVTYDSGTQDGSEEWKVADGNLVISRSGDETDQRFFVRTETDTNEHGPIATECFISFVESIN